MLTSVKPAASSIPFDTKRLDRLMEDAGIDVLFATSKHNVQYLLGGHRAFFFDYMDAMGLSRYLPIVVYAKGAPEKAAFFGHRLENFQREVKPFWTPEQNCASSGSVDVMKKAVEHVKKIGNVKRVGVEMAFLPMDSGGRAQKQPAGRRDRRCAVRAGAAARAQIACRARDGADRLRAGDRIRCRR